MGVEDEENAARSLAYLKKELQINPEMVVHDLSPNLISASAKVFGEEKIALDPFHVMQDLNRAILKDLGRFRKQNFTLERKELDLLKEFVIQIQKKHLSQTEQQNVIQSTKIADSHTIAKKCLSILEKISKIYNIPAYGPFFKQLIDALAECQYDNTLPVKTLGLSLQERLPKLSFTKKAMERMKQELLKKLKTLFRDCQRPLNIEQRQFNKTRWVLFYQPEHLTPKRAELLQKFLKQYPKLNQYRDLTLSIGSIYRLPNTLVLPNLIDNCPISDTWGDELKACLTTLKRYSPAIFRFKRFFENNPEAPKKCRANMEYQNVIFGRIFGSGNYMKSMNRIEKELQYHLGGQVRNFISNL